MSKEVLPEQPSLLKANLSPLLSEIRAVSSDEQRYKMARAFFTEHEENLAGSIQELAYLCILPFEERRFLTYPVIGNFALSRIDAFTAETPFQEAVKEKFRQVISEKRFVNSHLEQFHNEAFNHLQNIDELYALSSQNIAESLPILKTVNQVSREIADEVYNNRIPVNQDTLTTDLGHGLWGPIDHIDIYARFFDFELTEDLMVPLEQTIMVVDDEMPERWYSRMIAAGFRRDDNQQGYFSDAESALAALSNPQNSYDVIISDIELGEEKMDGVTFVQKAYDIERGRDRRTLISLFSASKEKLKEADADLRWKRGMRNEEGIVFDDLNFNHKAFFNATRFRQDVSRYFNRNKR